MPRATTREVELEYLTYGDSSSQAFVLIMGLDAQLIDWPTSFCELLAERGYYVVIFDNRDIGLSTSFDQLGTPDLAALLGGDPNGAPYLISDFADDTIGLMDALDIETAHILGVSMGGMIAQQIAIDHPSRVASLCSIMSTPGNPFDHGALLEAALAIKVEVLTREEVIERNVQASKASGSPQAGGVSDADIRAHATDRYDRSYRPIGAMRQTAAIVASHNRAEALGGVGVPTLVIHGEDDPLISVEDGRATATAIPGAKLIVVPNQGHQLPWLASADIVDAIAANAAEARHGA